MKKLIIVAASLLLLYILIVQLLIPSNKSLIVKKNINYPGNALVRLLHDRARLKNCLPGSFTASDHFKYQNAEFNIEKDLFNGIACIVNDNGNKVYGTLEVVGMENSQCQLVWSTNVEFSKNPFLRPVNLFQYKSIAGNISNMMNDLSSSCNKLENLYGFTINKIHIEESSMISTIKTFDHFPSNTEIYSMVNSIEKFIDENNDSITGSPMLNIHTDDSLNYSVMTAIPTKDEMTGSGDFRLKKMMMGNMLKATIKGGPQTIQNAKNQFNLYVEDYKKVLMAIPFETMVTNRLLVTDTSAWVTELYYPVFY